MKGLLLPLEISSDFSFGDTDGGEFHSWIEMRGTFTKYDKRGFFASYEFHAEPIYQIMVLNPLQLIVYVGFFGQYTASPRFPLIDKTDEPYSKNFKNLKWIFSTDLGNIGQWETVNTYDWTGHQAIEKKNGNGVVIERERPCWDVASVINGERKLAYRGHNMRDEVFAFNLRLNAFFDYWRAYLEPMREEILRVNPERASGLDFVRDEKDRKEVDKILEQIMLDVCDNPPP